jgi:hypothetical protein
VHCVSLGPDAALALGGRRDHPETDVGDTLREIQHGDALTRYDDYAC